MAEPISPTLPEYDEIDPFERPPGEGNVFAAPEAIIAPLRVERFDAGIPEPASAEPVAADAEPVVAEAMPLRRLLLALAVAIGLTVAFYTGTWFRAHSATPAIVGPMVSTPGGEPPTLVVQVAGAVAHPGVYHLAPGARVADAIAQAGGATAQGDPEALNLATFAEDGSRIEVPVKANIATTSISPASMPTSAPVVIPTPAPVHAAVLSPAKPATAEPAKSSHETHKPPPDVLAKHPVDLNTATAEQLQQLPSVGPVMASKIIAYRQQTGRFNTVDDLRNVSGIGPKKMETLRSLVIVR